MNNKKKITILSIIVLVVIIAVLIGVLVYRSSAPVKYKSSMDLGNKYLLEEDYEQAIAAFTVAIEINPMSVEAYLGIVEAYIGAEDFDSALEWVEKGIEVTGSEDLRNQKMELEQLIENSRQAEIIMADIEWLVENAYKINGENWDGDTSLSTYKVGESGVEKYEHNKNAEYGYETYGKLFSITSMVPNSPVIKWVEFYHKGNEMDALDCRGWANYETPLVEFLNSNSINSVHDMKKRWEIEDKGDKYSIQTKKYGEIKIYIYEKGVWLLFERQPFYPEKDMMFGVYLFTMTTDPFMEFDIKFMEDYDWEEYEESFGVD